MSTVKRFINFTSCYYRKSINNTQTVTRFMKSMVEKFRNVDQFDYSETVVFLDPNLNTRRRTIEER